MFLGIDRGQAPFFLNTPTQAFSNITPWPSYFEIMASGRGVFEKSAPGPGKIY